MNCPKAEEIVEQLLAPECESLLDEYVHRFEFDPHFLDFHAATTVLTLRTHLDLPFSHSSPCDECSMNSLKGCQIVKALEDAIRKRASKPGDIAA